MFTSATWIEMPNKEALIWKECGSKIHKNKVELTKETLKIII
jgi:hypothetical protein